MSMNKIALGILLMLSTLAGARGADVAIPLPRERPAAIRVASLVPLPRERPAEIVVAQAPTNPDPFNIKRADNGPTSGVAAPTSPIVVAAAPPASNDILGYIWAAIASVFTAIFGKIAFKPPALPGTAAPIDSGKVTDIVTAVLHPSGTSILSDPNLRATVDAALLKAVQSGLPGQALQSGLSLIPGAGPFATTLEPILRNIVIQALQKQAGTTAAQGPAAADPAAPASTNPLQDQLATLTGIVGDLAKAVAAKHAVSPA